MLTDIHTLGVKTAQGLLFTEAFYWDWNEETRAFSKRFASLHGGRPPTMFQAGIYSAAMHYLKAVKAAGTDEAKAVVAEMKKIPVNDFMTKNGTIREDGRMMRDMYLLEAKEAVGVQERMGSDEGWSRPFRRLMRDAKIAQIREGTNQIHRQLIGRSFATK